MAYGTNKEIISASVFVPYATYAIGHQSSCLQSHTPWAISSYRVCKENASRKPNEIRATKCRRVNRVRYGQDGLSQGKTSCLLLADVKRSHH